MGFVDAVRTCLNKYATFAGRASRPEYWYFVLFNLLVSLVGTIVEELSGGLGAVLGFVYALVALMLILPTLAVGARRLHDIGRTGWWLLLSFVPVIGQLVLLFWAIQRGNEGTNAYGPQPAA